MSLADEINIRIESKIISIKCASVVRVFKVYQTIEIVINKYTDILLNKNVNENNINRYIYNLYESLQLDVSDRMYYSEGLIFYFGLNRDTCDIFLLPFVLF